MDTLEITVAYAQEKQFVANCANHKLIIDFSKESGGQDQGPTPPEYFLTSLASCVGVYVLSYCRNTGLNPEGMELSIKAEKIAKPWRLDNINVDIKLPNAQVGKRKEALLKVAQECLIHNTIVNKPKINITLV